MDRSVKVLTVLVLIGTVGGVAGVAVADEHKAPGDVGPSADGLQHLTGHLNARLARAPTVRRVHPSTEMTLVFGLPVRDPVAVQDAIKRVSDPESPSYRHYMTPEEFGDTYGVDPADYQLFVAWAKSKHFAVVTYANRLALTVIAKSVDVEAALRIHLVYALRPDGTEFCKPDVEPAVDLPLCLLPISAAWTTTSFLVTRPL